MSINFCEEHSRLYNNMVKIVYEKISDNEIYIHSITSQLRQRGYATQSLLHFLEEHRDNYIYVFVSNELGTDENILDKWYIKLGFEKCIKNNISYNATHCMKPNK